MNNRFKMAIVLLFGFAISNGYAQSKVKIGANPGIVASSAVLEVEGTTGGFLNAGLMGFYWSATVNVTEVKRIYFEPNNIYSGPQRRPFGFSVRCIKN